MSLADRLEDKRVVVCAGSGGVGKTTTSAALALGLAGQGLTVAVVTIDPARRLADSLGLEELGNEPQRVDPRRLAEHGADVPGELWAMMLDVKRTFDEVIGALAPDARTRDEILGNRIYQHISDAVAGSQEFTAIAKLYELDRDGAFDVIVLDTPPSRNALDFLDAPDRLTNFLEGRALRAFLAPTGLAARVVGRGTAAMFAILRRITGADLLGDLSTFFRSLGGLLDGFRERARGVRELLADPATTFLVVSSGQRDPVEEAIFFCRKLREAGLPLGGLIVNRIVEDPEPARSLEEIEDRLAPPLGEALARKVATTVAEVRRLAARDAAGIERLVAATGDQEPVLVPQLAGDVHDVAALQEVRRHLLDGR